MIAAAALAALSDGAFAAQRSGEDVLESAEDAFGTTVGGETIGLYNALSARGFSPVQAGNLRNDEVSGSIPLSSTINAMT